VGDYVLPFSVSAPQIFADKYGLRVCEVLQWSLLFPKDRDGPCRPEPTVRYSYEDRPNAEGGYRVERQPDGRIRLWGWIPTLNRWLRVVTLPDGETVHTVFQDRDFQP
jgi:hypothetical protein